MATTLGRKGPPDGTATRIVRLLGEPREIPAAVRRVVARRTTAKRSPHRLTRVARVGLITRHVDLAGRGLEIGPSHNPLLPKADGYDVRIADYLDRAGLTAKYDGVRRTDRIEEVDYVVGPGRLTDWIGDQFDYIVASHVMEHTPCLVTFLQDCEALLKPGGVLTLALPDKRYCFDRFRDRSSLGRVIDVYRGAPSVHSEGSVLEHFLMYARRGGAPSWTPDDAGPYTIGWTAERALKEASAAARGEYVDTHNWVFTPNHFRLLLEDLATLGFVGLRELDFHDTVGPEFFVSLSANAPGPRLERQELLTRSAREAMTPDQITFA